LLYCGTTIADTPVLQHDLLIQIDAQIRSFTINDRITVAKETDDTTPTLPALSMDPAWRISALNVDGRAVDPLPNSNDGQFTSTKGATAIEIEYSGEVDDTQWPYLIWLPDSHWYPDAPGYRHRFRLQVTLPEGWTALTQGAPDNGTPAATRTWIQDDPQQGIYLVAGPWHHYEEQEAGYRSAVMLLDDDPTLAQPYLDAATHWMARYSEAIGPYPYHQFTLVENRDQTGWGMPGFTLLGSRVIRLPFILDSSFPHEILHNWWGNSVFVDRSAGNWSEGLTTYLSDYLIRDSRGEARQHRLDTLNGWHDFAADGRDFPLSRFTGRHDRSTQAVGYGKGLFLFHMLRGKLGDETFLAGLRMLYERFRFREADFVDVRGAFEDACDCELEEFFAQWLEREGAPRLELVNARTKSVEDRHSVTFTLRQVDDLPWRLNVPVRINLTDGTSNTELVPLNTESQTYTLSFDVPVTRLDVDPDYDLFRHLEDDERPVTFSRVFGADEVAVVPLSEPFNEVARSLASNNPGWRVVARNDLGDTDVVVFLVEPSSSLSEELMGTSNRVQLRDSQVILDSVEYPIDANDVIATVDHWSDDERKHDHHDGQRRRRRINLSSNESPLSLWT
jgi:aminopeptidase N